MTMQHVGETAIKILGIYYGASAVFTFVAMLAGLLMPQQEGWPTGFELAAMNVGGVLAAAGVAIVFLWRGRSLAAAIFSREPVLVSTLSTRDFLFVGVCVIGLTWALAGVPAVLEVLGKAIWYAEGSRQALLPEMLRQSSATLVNAGLSILIGLSMIASARRLADRLDASR